MLVASLFLIVNIAFAIGVFSVGETWSTVVGILLLLEGALYFFWILKEQRRVD